jgi:DNA-binding SARP family transcriptional activator/tetratricopeptide (TPR) repeat protein
VLDLRFCGGVEVEVDGRLLPESLIGGRQGRLALAYLACERDRAVRREELAELLWSEQLPESWTASLSAVISRLRRLFTEAGFDGTAVVVSTPGAYELVLPPASRIDVDDLVVAVRDAEAAAATGDNEHAIATATHAEAVAARGFLADDCEWVDARRDAVRDLRVRACVAQSVAQLASGATGRAIESARRAVECDGAKEAAYRQLMLALTAAGERAEALRVWERCRITLVEELGIDPSPETEAVYRALLDNVSAPASAAAPIALPSGVVTFLLTDIVESAALWEQHATAMATTIERHDALIAVTVAAHDGTMLKSKLEGDATVSVFARATECAAAALALLDAIEAEPWPDGARPRVRMALHTGEAFERGGDYFGPALNRAARLRALAGGGEVLLSQAVTELVRDHLPDGVVVRDRGRQQLRGLTRSENVFELTRLASDAGGSGEPARDDPLERPPVPPVLAGAGPFVGRAEELQQLDGRWQRARAGDASAVFVGGEPGVGKSRLAGELARKVYDDGGFVVYGRCDEDLTAPLQPFIEAVRMLAPALGAALLRSVRGVDELTRVVPELTQLLGEKPGVRADPDTERLALFDAMAQLFVVASDEVPVLLILDDLHWAGKSTLSLLRHLLRGTTGSRLLVVGTYRDTELARTHPLAETLADLRRDTSTHRLTLTGLAAADVGAYLTAIGNTDRALGRELAEVTAGNPFFLIEVVRHVEESGGAWQPGSLPEGVREATGRRLSRLSERANEALAVAAVAGTTFDLALVEQVCSADLVDPIAEAVQAGLVVEEPNSFARFRFAHAIVRQVLLAELVSLKRVRLHRAIAELLESAALATDPDALLADLAYHWFECAAAGSADKAVAACRQAADRAMDRLAYDEAGDLYGRALESLEWVEAADPDVVAALHLARCDALLTAGDVAGARAAIDALELAAAGSERLAAWYTTYEGLLAVLGERVRLTEIVQSIGAAAGAMRDVGDLTGEAKARYVHASALERLGQIGAAERALDTALAAARTAGDRRLADAILAETAPAALWGPSPVTRASGRCLDVVRVLRITSGTAAVEAVMLRCQAVLEALRGRMDAARRMIASSRRTVEQLGLTLRLLETELAAGLIELLDGETVAAEEFLRAAHDGLRERGLDGEAAHAAAVLGRSLLMQGRVDEADDAAAAAEALAGSNLKAAITWRDVRAEVALQRGDLDRAFALAREAVELASATDALLLVADARLTLAGVLRAMGDETEADAEARRALEAAHAKGATVLVARIAEATGVTPVAGPESLRSTSISNPPAPNLASATMQQFQELFNRGDWAAVRETRADTYKLDDRRLVVGMTGTSDDSERSGIFARAGGGRLTMHELLAARGDSLALGRWNLQAPDMEVQFLAITRVDAEGRGTDFVMFEPEAIDDALAELDLMARAHMFETEATRVAARFGETFNAHDWDATLAFHRDDYVLEERRAFTRVTLSRERFLETLRLVYDGNGIMETDILSTRGSSLFLARITLRVPDPEATATVLMVSLVEDGCYRRGVSFDPDDLDAATAELDRIFLEHEGREHAGVLEAVGGFIDRLRARDTAGASALLASGLVVREHGAVSAPAAAPDTWLSGLWSTIDVFGDVDVRVDHVLDLSADGGLWVMRTVGTKDDGAFELPWLMDVRVADGRISSLHLFDSHNVDAARAARAETPVAEAGNAAWRGALRQRDALNHRNWQEFLDATDESFVLIDNRHAVQLRVEAAEALESNHVGFEIDEIRQQRTLLATRGDHLALISDLTSFSDGQTGLSEVESLTVVESTLDGRVGRHTTFNVNDIEAAYAVLDARAAELAAEAGNTAWRAALRHRDAYNHRSWQEYVEATDPAFVYVDQRNSIHLRLEGAEALASHRVGFTVDELWQDRTLVATRGDLLVLTRDLTRFSDGQVGEAELETLTIVEATPDARVCRHTAFNTGDLDAAYAALDARAGELDAAAHLAWFENAAWRAATALRDASNRRDWQAALDTFDPAFVYIDLTHGNQLRLVREHALDPQRVLFGIDESRQRGELVATRGDRLALMHEYVWMVDGVAGPAEIETLTLVETGLDGRTVMSTVMTPEDMGKALDLLDAAYVAQGGSDYSSMRHSFEARDWETFAAGFAPDCSIADYRTAGWGEVNRESFVDYQRSVVALAPDARLWVDHARERGNVGLSVGRAFGTHGGGAWEIPFASVGRVGPDGAGTHLENYELTDFAIALRRFEELTG